MGNHGAPPRVPDSVAFVTQPILQRPNPLLRSPESRSVAACDAVDPDLELIDRWRAGDAQAFEELVRRHERRIFGLLLRMLGNRQEAEDAAQDTFLNLHRHGHRFRREARFSTFLYRVAMNAALNRRRSLGRRRSHMEALVREQAGGSALPSAPRGPEDATFGGEIRARVEQALQTLPPALRGPVVLYDIEGLAYGDIAEVLQIAEGTVKSRIHRARRALRERLGDLVHPQDPDGSALHPDPSE